MNDFDEELAQLRGEVIVPDAEATRRVAARLSRSIGALGVGQASPVPGMPGLRPLSLVTSFVVGGIAGAALYGALRAPRVEKVYVERPSASVQAPVTSAPPVASAPPATSALPEVAPAPRPAALTPSASASGERLASLAEQQAMLDVARAAFARSDYSATLKTLATHAARFPKSVLGEEREALQIKALAANDQLTQARTLAARFQTRHPQSLLLPSIKDSVGTIP
ncbi:MAG TPA: hypothetical protein VFK05_24115 [Polyangiaceae bacterium]|nr:hypothetical protein [Polyangiaceae bacterium]